MGGIFDCFYKGIHLDRPFTQSHGPEEASCLIPSLILTTSMNQVLATRVSVDPALHEQPTPERSLLKSLCLGCDDSLGEDFTYHTNSAW